MLPVMINMKRLWGFYIQIPFMFVFLGFFVLAEEALTKKLISGLSLSITRLTFAFVFFYTLTYLGVQSYYNGQKLWRRSKDYALLIPEYRKICGLLDWISIKSRKRLTVSLEGMLYWPLSTANYEIDPWYYPYKRWDEKAFDIIIQSNQGLFKAVHPRSTEIQNTTNWFVNRLWFTARAEYPEHVSYAANKCKKSPCYYQYPCWDKTVVILVKDSIPL
jgi:hypothetical protein